MAKTEIKQQHTASFEQLKTLLSVAAGAISANKSALQTKANAASLGQTNTRVAALEGLVATDNVTRQLAIMYLMPSWKEGVGYSTGQMVRVGGKIFTSLSDNNTACPFSTVGNGDGNIIVNDNWQALILDDVMDENWAQMDMDDVPSMSIHEMQTVLNTKLSSIAYTESSVNEKYADFIAKYATLSSEHAALQSEHATLLAEHATLLDNYSTLQSEHAAISEQYSTLMDNYSALAERLEAVESVIEQLGQHTLLAQ